MCSPVPMNVIGLLVAATLRGREGGREGGREWKRERGVAEIEMGTQRREGRKGGKTTV